MIHAHAFDLQKDPTLIRAELMGAKTLFVTTKPEPSKNCVQKYGAVG